MRHKYLIVAYDGDTVKEYLINTASRSAAKARERFNQIVQAEDWKPFQHIEVYNLNVTNELQNLLTHTLVEIPARKG